MTHLCVVSEHSHGGDDTRRRACVPGGGLVVIDRAGAVRLASLPPTTRGRYVSTRGYNYPLFQGPRKHTADESENYMTRLVGSEKQRTT